MVIPYREDLSHANVTEIRRTDRRQAKVKEACRCQEEAVPAVVGLIPVNILGIAVFG